MKNYILIIFLFSIISHSQVNPNSVINQLENRTGNLFLNIGPEYRITPYYESMQIRNNNSSIDFQNSGLSLYYSLNFFINKTTSVNFAHSFRYDLLQYNNQNSFPLENYSKKAENVLMMDFHTFLDYHIYLSRKNEVFIRIGVSMMNRGTDYNATKTYYNPDGSQLLSTVEERNFNYYAANFGVGLKQNKLDVMVGFYGSNNTPYFNNNNTIIVIPYIKIGYRILKLYTSYK